MSSDGPGSASSSEQRENARRLERDAYIAENAIPGNLYLATKRSPPPSKREAIARSELKEAGVELEVPSKSTGIPNSYRIVKLPEGWQLTAKEDDSRRAVLRDDRGRTRAVCYYDVAGRGYTEVRDRSRYEATQQQPSVPSASLAQTSPSTASMRTSHPRPKP